MTPDEIISLARAEFGEDTVLTVSTTTELDFLNAAVREIYEDLSPSRLKNLLSEVAVTLTNGRGAVLATWDKIIEVYVDDAPAFLVSREAIHHHDHNEFFSSPVPIFHVDDSYIWVRPTASECEVVFLSPPSEITSGDRAVEYTDIDEMWHTAAADLVASYMYAQEEDIQQAEAYRNSYQQKLAMLLAPEAAE